MNIVKWNPLRELEDMQMRLNRFFTEVPRSERPFFADWAPAVDIQETPKEYVLKADLPEVKKEDVKVALENGILTVEGERHQEKEETGKKFHRVERAYGKFVRRFEMPTEIDGGTAQADFKEGVLTVRLPKTVAARPKTIELKVA